jgi:hypothetical protein
MLGQLVFLLLVVGGIFVFKDQIAAYFGIEVGKPAAVEKEALLPDEGMIKSNNTALYNARNGKQFATASGGDRVRVLAAESGWVQIHHNGLTAWVRSGDIDLSDGQ